VGPAYLNNNIGISVVTKNRRKYPFYQFHPYEEAAFNHLKLSNPIGALQKSAATTALLQSGHRRRRLPLRPFSFMRLLVITSNDLVPAAAAANLLCIAQQSKWRYIFNAMGDGGGGGGSCTMLGYMHGVRYNNKRYKNWLTYTFSPVT
jgi:hypothetical protein